MFVRQNARRQRGRKTVGSDEITWKDFVSAVAEMFESLARAVKALAEYMGMSADVIFPGGYTPIEYARKKCKRKIAREQLQLIKRKSLRITPWCSVPNMVWKKGRWVKRG